MDRGLKVGDRVREDRHGTGRVHALRQGGGRVVVRFDNLPGLPVALDADKVHPVGERPAAPSIGTPADALATVESLKMGVVSGMAMDRLTVGNREHLDGISQDLDRAASTVPGGAFRLLVGTYGTGKTHALDLNQNMALARRFLVARAVFDLHETTPDKPTSVYTALASSIRYPQGPSSGRVGLGPLLEEAAAAPAVFRNWTGRSRFNDKRPEDPTRDNRYFGTALFGLRMAKEAGDDAAADGIISWIEGRPQNMALLRWRLRQLAKKLRLPFAVLGKFGYNPMSLPRWRSVTQIMSYLLGSIGVLASDLGYSGLAVLLDEAEYFDVVHPRLKSHATRLARALLATSVPGARHEDLERGGPHRISQLPYRFERVQHVVATMTMTPQEAVAGSAKAGEAHLTHLVRSNGGDVSELTALNMPELRELSERVLDLARQAGIAGAAAPGLGPAMTEYLETLGGRDTSPRQVVRLAAQLPDLVRDATSLTPATIREWASPGRKTRPPTGG